MAERPDQIERHIESARTELGSNLQELEYKVKQATDWRTHFERNPMSDTWDTLKSAVIGFTAFKVRKVLDDALPGFGEHFEKAEREVSSRGLSRPHTYDRELEASTHRM